MIRLLQNRYFILLINLLIIGFLLLIWTSDTLINYYTSDFFFEGLKLLGLSVVVTFGYLFINKLVAFKVLFNSEIKSRVCYAIILILIVFGYMYVQYTTNIIRVTDSKRNELIAKLKRTKELNGTAGYCLTYDEYLIVKKYIGLPKIPIGAYDINYTYSYDGFLPDYMITLHYKLPLKIPVENINFEHNNFTKYQSVDTLSDFKKVTYEEILR